MIVSATTAGDFATFRVGEYNLPLSVTGNETFTFEGTVAESSAKHPTGHADALAQGYDTAEVKACSYRFTVRFAGTDSGTKDWVFAYKFGTDPDVSNEVAFTAGVLSVDQWHNMQMTRSWTYRRFSAINSGGSIWPSSGIINIPVPSVPKLQYAMNKHVEQNDDVSNNPNRFDILDGTTVGVSELPTHLHWCVFTSNGTPFAAGDVVVEIQWTGRVNLQRRLLDENIIENLDHGT